MRTTRACRHLSFSLITAVFAIAAALPMLAQQGVFENKDEQKLRQEAFWSTHRDSQGVLRPDVWQSGIEQFLTMRAAQLSWLNLPGATAWLQVGPQPLRIINEKNFQGSGPDSGEVVDIAIDPDGSMDSTVYIATNDGGIWKTSDGGSTWTPLTDTGCPDATKNCPSLSMGAVALSPVSSGVVYAGTGNPFDGGVLFTKGVGIYRSTNRGMTWTILNPKTMTKPDGIFTNVAINRIVIQQQPGSVAETLLVATNMGLFRSIDHGDNFGNNPPDFNNGLPVLAGYIFDLKLDTPIRPGIVGAVYAAVVGAGVYRSWDGGVTFPTNLFDNPGAPMAGKYTSLSLAQSTKPNNQRLYASVAAVDPKNNTYLALYRSDDGGRSWLKPTATNLPAKCQCDYDLTIGVDPQDMDRVYVGFQELWRSTDGGATFATPAVTANQVHWDHHAIYFSPASHQDKSPTRLWVGTDGGVASSKDGGTTWENLNETIATNLFKHIDIGRNSSGNIAYSYGGTQDTGTPERRPEFDKNDWHLGIDSDGAGTAVDPFDPKTAYASDGGYYYHTSDGGDTWTFGASPPAGWRYAVDPNSSSHVYAIDATPNGFHPGTDLYRSDDKGMTFAKIGMSFPVAIRSINNTQLNSSLLWLGMADGSMERCSTPLGADPGCVKIPDQSGTGHAVGGISIILVDPSDATKDRVIAAYEGVSKPTNKHVFYSKNSGKDWKDISNTVPDLPTHSVYGSAAISNDAGVMFTDDLGSHWRVLGTNLPTVDSPQLAAGTCPPIMRLGTYGRSVWELNPSSETGFYDNGPVNGHDPGTLSRGISGGGWVSNSFRAPGSKMSGVTFSVWVPHMPPQMPMFTLWSVTDQPHGGNICASGNATLTPTFLFTNELDFDVYTVTFSIPVLPLTIGATYFLNLEGFLTDKGGPGWWDQNSGVKCKGSGVDLDGMGANCPSYGFGPGGSAPSETFSVSPG